MAGATYFHTKIYRKKGSFKTTLASKLYVECCHLEDCKSDFRAKAIFQHALVLMLSKSRHYWMMQYKQSWFENTCGQTSKIHYFIYFGKKSLEWDQ